MLKKNEEPKYLTESTEQNQNNLFQASYGESSVFKPFQWKE